MSPPASCAWTCRPRPRSGPAGLLCHQHDESLWNLRSLLVRGALARDERGWRFEPGAIVPGMDQRSPRAMLRFLIDSRRRAAAYLTKRGLPRPAIPWAEIIAVKRRALAKGSEREH